MGRVQLLQSAGGNDIREFPDYGATCAAAT